MKRTVTEWELSKLKPHPQQSRFFTDLPAEQLQQLADDIQQHGLRHKIEITDDGTIVCGHQRLRALELLGRTSAKCIVLPGGPGDALNVARMISDNVHRRQLGKLDLARLYKRLGSGRATKGLGKTRDQIAKLLGIGSGRTLDNYRRVLKAPVPLQEAWDQKRLTLGQVKQVLKLTPEQQKSLAAQIQNGESPKQALSTMLAPASPSRSTARQTTAASAPVSCRKTVGSPALMPTLKATHSTAKELQTAICHLGLPGVPQEEADALNSCLATLVRTMPRVMRQVQTVMPN